MGKIKFIINSKQVEGKRGSSVLDVCRANGIYLPTLCHLEGISDTGACRMCLVEIEGMDEPQAACVTPAVDGMKIRTDTKKLRELRRMNLELLLAERTHFCMFCPKSGDCELQKLAYEYGVDHVRFSYAYRPFPIDTSHPYLIVDHNRCVLCGRCVRVCREIVGNCTLDFKDRGWETTICAELDQPIGNSNCTSCGACVQACPTGAISSKFSVYLGREEECKTKRTFCPLCGVGCEINAFVRNNTLVKIEGTGLTRGDGGQLCERGRFGLLAETRSRIITPLVRNSQGRLEGTSWAHALDFVAKRLGIIEQEFGGGVVAGLISSRYPSEEILFFREFMSETIGSNLLDTLDGNVYRTLSLALVTFQKEWPEVRIGCDLGEILRADCVVMIEADPVRTQPVVASFIRRAVLRGGRALAIAREEGPMSPWTELCLKPKRGTEVLIGGLANLVSQKSAVKRGARYRGLLQKLRQCSPERVCSIAEVRMEDLERCAELLAGAGRVVFLCDPARSSSEALVSLLNLALVKAASLKEPLGVIFLPPRGNSLAAWKLGAAARIDWITTKREVKGAYVLWGDDDFQNGGLLEWLRGMELVVAHCSYHSPIDSVADVILPVPIWAEKGGTYSTLEGKIFRQSNILKRPAGVREDWWIMIELAKRFGRKMKYRRLEDLIPEVKGKLKGGFS